MKKITLKQAPEAIKHMQEFDAGNLKGTMHYRGIGRAERKHIHDVAHADFVVYSYETPIAWATVLWNGTTWTMIDKKFSATTNRHMAIVNRSI